MSEMNDGGQAFPGQTYLGMTLRDYFAAKAMATFPFSLYEHDTDEAISKASYRLADAMLKAREEIK